MSAGELHFPEVNAGINKQERSNGSFKSVCLDFGSDLDCVVHFVSPAWRWIKGAPRGAPAGGGRLGDGVPCLDEPITIDHDLGAILHDFGVEDIRHVLAVE